MTWAFFGTLKEQITWNVLGIFVGTLKEQITSYELGIFFFGAKVCVSSQKNLESTFTHTPYVSFYRALAQLK
jgi:hypothetical protein